MAYIPVATDETQPVDTVDRSTAAAEFRTLKSYIKTTILGLIASLGAVTGEIKPFCGSAAPAGYLLVPTVATDISRSTYGALHTLIATAGYPWGAGDGSTTFGMPYIPNGYTLAQAAALGSYTAGSTMNHTHTVNDPTHSHGVTDPTHSHGITKLGGGTGGNTVSFSTQINTPSVPVNTVAAATGVSVNAATTGITVGSAGGAANTPASLGIRFIIKT